MTFPKSVRVPRTPRGRIVLYAGAARKRARSQLLRNVALCVGFLLSVALSATAQDHAAEPFVRTSATYGSSPAISGFEPSRWQLAVGYQYNRIDILGAYNPFDTNGLNVSLTRYFSRGLGIEAEVGGGIAPASNVSAESIFVGVGPHLAYRTRSRFEPWVHGLGGLENFNFSGGPFPGNTASFAWIFGAGLDYRFDSGLSLRLRGDYLGTTFGGTYQRNLQLVGGVVWNFNRTLFARVFRAK